MYVPVKDGGYNVTLRLMEPLPLNDLRGFLHIPVLMFYDADTNISEISSYLPPEGDFYLF